jgi:hypothetical protein
MQHLNRRLEHLDEFENALVGPIETAGIAIRVRVVLGQALELADIDLADERGNAEWERGLAPAGRACIAASMILIQVPPTRRIGQRAMQTCS